MDFREYAEQQDIEFECIARVNGEIVGRVESYSFTGIEEDYRKLNHAIETKLNEDYESLPERTMDDNEQ